MKRRITLYLEAGTVLVATLIWMRGSPIRAQKLQEKTQAEAGRTEKAAQASHEPSKAEADCIVRMLSASTPAQAKARKAACKDSFVARAYYASLLVKLHAPNADDEIVRNLPQNLADLHAFYDAPDMFYANNYVNYSDALMIGHAYERYYKSLFRIVAERPSLLPRFFAIADRFEAPVGDNVDETGWFCNALHDIEVKIPSAYWRAVRQTKNKERRENARECALNPVP